MAKKRPRRKGRAASGGRRERARRKEALRAAFWAASEAMRDSCSVFVFGWGRN